MNLEKLEKLNELREKGILTQEEFEAEKKKLLQADIPNVKPKVKPQKQEIQNKDTKESQTFSLKNFIISFFMMICYLILLIIIVGALDASDKDVGGIHLVVTTLLAILMTFYAIKIETYKYKDCSSAWAIFLVIIFLGPLGIWGATYQFLQIKGGLAKLEDSKKDKKRNKIITGIGILFLFGILFVLIFTSYTKIKHLTNTSSLSENSQSEEKTDSLLDILQYFELSADEIMTENGYSEYHEMMKNWWKKATLKDITDILDNGFEINKKYQGDMTLILFACNYAENPEIIDLLINHGATLDLNNALLLASSNENGSRIIEYLIKKGANVNYKQHWTPLMMAARWNRNPDVVEVLLNNGANVNDQESGGMTATHLAAYGNSNPQVLESLIKHGGKVDYELLTWAQENSNEVVNLVNEYFQKVPLSPNEDCIQAVERAHHRRLEISNDYVLVFPSHTVETVTLDKRINQHSKEEWYVTDFTDNGLIISTKCPDASSAVALFGGWGALAVASCKEQRMFIYTKNTDYATDEIYGKHHLLHKKAGYYKYITILGKTHSIPAAQELNVSISEVEYKTYLKNKQLKCCRENGKTKVCN